MNSPLHPAAGTSNSDGMEARERSIPLAEAHYSPRAAAGPPARVYGHSPVSHSPISMVQSAGSSDAAEYSENARLVGSSALSDDGMTPLIRPSRTRKERALQFCKQLGRFVAAHWSKGAVLAVLITIIVLVAVKGFGFFGDILLWFQRHNGWAGWGIFVGMYTATVALFLPGVILILGAGFVFGFWRGLLAVWAGGAVGQALAFLLARYLFHGWVESTLKRKWEKWAIIDKAIEVDGWKLVLIMRFSPIIPYNLLNIAMATTNIPFWQFTLVSAVGIVYECAIFAYFGSMADNIHSIIAGEGGPPPVFEWVMLGISLVMVVVVALFVSHSIKQAIKRAQSQVGPASGLGYDEDGRSGDLEGLEGGRVRMDGSYPASLEREGFVGSSTGYSPLHQQPASPEFELKAVGSSGSAAAGSAAAAAAPREKAAAARNTFGKQKTSPRASVDRDLSRHSTGGMDGGGSGSGGGKGGVDGLPPRATRRHPSTSSENMV
ncbi:TVP38/TMEM64 family membrane protein [Chlorella vulgaris]